MLAKALKKGDKIGFVCPSSYLEKEKVVLVNNTIKILNNFGFKIAWGKNAKKIDKYGISAGSPEERAEDINSFFKNLTIKAIWCIQGGDTANQILDLLDYDIIKNNPKIFMGLSDNTVLINAIYKKTGLITIHGTDAKIGNKNEYFDSQYSQDAFQKRLIYRNREIEKNSEWKCIRKGKVQGKLIGGHLGCFLKLVGTQYMPEIKNSILLQEAYYLDIATAISRLTQMKQLGIFDQINGIVVGYVYGFDKEKQYDRNKKRVFFEDILKDLTKEYDFPILKIYEFGHKCPSAFLPIGGTAEIDAEKRTFKLIGNFIKNSFREDKLFV